MTRSRVKNDFSVGIDDGADANAITIDSSEQVGIGTASPSDKLHVYGGSSGGTTAHSYTQLHIEHNSHAAIQLSSPASTESVIFFSDPDDNDIGGVGYYHAQDYLYLRSVGATRLRVDADGIKFGSDSAAANALDDYEEGTWTPTITSGINSISYNVQAAHYTKIGNIVNTDFYINASGTGSGAQFVVSGLPYAAKNVNYVRGGGCSTYQNFTSNTVQFYGNQGSSFFYCYVDGSTTLTTSGTIGGKYLIGTFSYLSA